MIDINKLKPIPKHIIEIIKKKDTKKYYNNLSFYSYFSTISKELCLITVACKTHEKQWFCKQVCVHGISSKECYVKDIEYSLFGFTVGWYKEGISQVKQPYNDNRWCSAEDKYYKIITDVINKKYPLKFDEFKYSMCDKYKYYDIMKYLKTFLQYPQTEYLMKLNLQQFATSKSILRKLGKDKNFRKWIIKNKVELENKYGNYPFYSSKTILFAYKNNLSPLDGFNLYQVKKDLIESSSYNSIKDLIPDSEIFDLIHYLDKEKTSIYNYKDYIDACKGLNIDLTIKDNKYPHKFQVLHDLRIEQYNSVKAKEDERRRKELYLKFANVANKYLPLERNLNDEFITLIAKSPADLFYEGEKLNHCVGRMGYDVKFADEKTLIFFIRAKDNPNLPLVTVEYSLQNHKILQCYADHDTKPSDEILTYVNKIWLPYANRKIKKVA